MDFILADGARQLFADNLFETVKRCYHEANKDYLQKQIDIAKEYLTEDQKEWLSEHGYYFNSNRSLNQTLPFLRMRSKGCGFNSAR